MNAAAGGLLAGFFIGWWAGALTALACLAQAQAFRDEEAQFATDTREIGRGC